MIAPARLAVFVDYQNVYRRGRDAMGLESEPGYVGQVNPFKLGRLIASMHKQDGGARLERVFVYRGLPDGHKDPKGYAACRRQIAAWEALPSVTVIARPLRYPRGYPTDPPQEKGIDVKIALDFVDASLRKLADLLVLFSADTDLLPALEMVQARRATTGVRPMSAAWQNAPRLGLEGVGWWCFNLTPGHFETVRDDTDYNLAKQRSGRRIIV